MADFCVRAGGHAVLLTGIAARSPVATIRFAYFFKTPCANTQKRQTLPVGPQISAPYIARNEIFTGRVGLLRAYLVLSNCTAYTRICSCGAGLYSQCCCSSLGRRPGLLRRLHIQFRLLVSCCADMQSPSKHSCGPFPPFKAASLERHRPGLWCPHGPFGKLPAFL